jgi:hypothetical protein
LRGVPHKKWMGGWLVIGYLSICISSWFFLHSEWVLRRVWICIWRRFFRYIDRDAQLIRKEIVQYKM